MQKQKNFQIAIIGVLAFAVLFMSVGFAAYSQNLDIRGTTTIGANKWSVHFDKDTMQTVVGSVASSSVDLSDETASLGFKANLGKPGDYFAFTVDVVNDGTFDAVLKSIAMTELTEAEAKLVKFSVKYDSDTYTSTTTGIQDALNYNIGNNTKTLLVRVEYRDDVSAADIPATDTEVSLSVSLNYEQN